MKKKSPKRLVLSSETLRRLESSWVRGGAGFELDSDGACPPSEPDNTCFWGCSVEVCPSVGCTQG